MFSAKFFEENSRKTQSWFLPWEFHRKNQVNIFLINLYHLRIIDAILNDVNDIWYSNNISNVKYDFFHVVFGVAPYFIEYLNTSISKKENKKKKNKKKKQNRTTWTLFDRKGNFLWKQLSKANKQTKQTNKKWYKAMR